MSDPATAAEPTSRTKRPGFRILAAVLALGVALGVVEAALRLAEGPALARRVAYYEFVKLSEAPLVWGFRPGATVRFVWDTDPWGTLPPGAEMTCGINGLGLRGPPPPRDTRLLVVGDSFTFGEGVALEDTFAARLDRSLGGGVVNAGVPGYGTSQEAWRLREWIDALHPQAVLVVYVPNDPVSVEDSMAHGEDLLQQGAEDRGGPAVVRLFRGAFGGADTEDWYRSYYLGDRSHRWVETRRALREMSDICRARGIPMGVALFPLLHRLSDRPFADLHEQVGEACREADLPFLDLTPAFDGISERDLWVHPTDHHPNARAHELAASFLEPFARSLSVR